MICKESHIPDTKQILQRFLPGWQMGRERQSIVVNTSHLAALRFRIWGLKASVGSLWILYWFLGLLIQKLTITHSMHAAQKHRLKNFDDIEDRLVWITCIFSHCVDNNTVQNFAVLFEVLFWGLMRTNDNLNILPNFPLNSKITFHNPPAQ